MFKISFERAGVILSIKKCIRCKKRIHKTDWIILKEMSMLPICDDCSLSEVTDKVEISKKKKNNIFYLKEKK